MSARDLRFTNELAEVFAGVITHAIETAAAQGMTNVEFLHGQVSSIKSAAITLGIQWPSLAKMVRDALSEPSEGLPKLDADIPPTDHALLG